MCSTSFKSMVTLATSRKKRTRSPLAEMSMFSATLAPLNSMRVDPVAAFDHVAAIARIPLEQIVARTHERHVVALVAVDEVVAVAAQQLVVTPAAQDRVVARAAVDGELHDPGHDGRGVDPVVSAAAR